MNDEDDYTNLYSDDESASAIIVGVYSGIIKYATPLYFKQPYHTCPFTGMDWVHDLMKVESHPERIRHELGVHLHVFKRLLYVLRKMNYSDSKHVLLEEQLAIFLYACGTGLSIRYLGERFQRSNETISKYLHTLLHCL